MLSRTSSLHAVYTVDKVLNCHVLILTSEFLNSNLPNGLPKPGPRWARLGYTTEVYTFQLLEKCLEHVHLNLYNGDVFSTSTYNQQ